MPSLAKGFNETPKWVWWMIVALLAAGAICFNFAGWMS